MVFILLTDFSSGSSLYTNRNVDAMCNPSGPSSATIPRDGRDLDGEVLHKTRPPDMLK